MRRVLVMGFGPFGRIRDNPAAQLAHGIDGWRRGDLFVVGREMPVEYEGSRAHTRTWVEATGPVALIGVGVARGRSRVEVERFGRLGPGVREVGEADNAGVVAPQLDGPPVVEATGPVAAFAQALGAGVSEDAGRYVCNAWLRGAVLDHGARMPVLFVHVPDEPASVDAFARAIDACWGAPASVG